VRALPRREDAGDARGLRRGGPHGSLGDTSRANVAVVAVLAVLAWPATANAHIRTGAVAVDYRVSVFPTGLPLTAHVYLGDRALRLTVRPGHTVTVLGYAGEPFVRIGPAGVAVDEHSPTAEALRLAGRRSAGRSFVWHDVRVRGLPPGTKRANWTIRLVVDGRRARIAGEIWRVDAPAPWPWVALGIPFVPLTTWLLVVCRRPALELSAVLLGVLAGVVAIVTAAAFAFASNASEGRWVEAANEAVFALVGLAVVARGSRDVRVTAAGALGLLALAVGVSKVPVLTHGVVLAALPAAPTRIAVTLTMWIGAAATALGLVLFAELLE
jgi:hypothetical protein